jgi:hypothetical protein
VWNDCCSCGLTSGLIAEGLASAGFYWGPERGILDLPGTSIAYAINDSDRIVGLGLAANPNDPLAAFVTDGQMNVTPAPGPQASPANVARPPSTTPGRS